MWCRPPVPRAARARDAWLCHVSSVGGARCRGCAAAGAPESFCGLLDCCGDLVYERLDARPLLLADPQLEAAAAVVGLGGELDRAPAFAIRAGDLEMEHAHDHSLGLGRALGE